MQSIQEKDDEISYRGAVHFDKTYSTTYVSNEAKFLMSRLITNLIKLYSLVLELHPGGNALPASLQGMCSGRNP